MLVESDATRAAREAAITNGEVSRLDYLEGRAAVRLTRKFMAHIRFRHRALSRCDACEGELKN
jgi:hypothetical protein